MGATLPEIQDRLREILPEMYKDHNREFEGITSALWSHRGNAEFKEEFEHQWNSLVRYLQQSCEVIDDLEVQMQEREEEAAKRRVSNITREGEVRIRIEKELNEQLRARKELQDSIRQGAAPAPMVDPEIRQPRGGGGVLNRLLRRNPAGANPRAELPPLVPDEDIARARELEDEGVDAAGEAALAAAKAAKKGAIIAGQMGIAGGKIAVKGLDTLGGATVRGAKTGGRAAVSALGALGGVAVRGASAAGESWHLWLLFLLGLLSHAYVFFFVQGRMDLGLTIVWGALMALFYWLFTGVAEGEYSGKVFGTGLLISALEAALYLSSTWVGELSFLNQVVVDSWRVFIIIVPFWPLAMLARINSRNPASIPGRLFRFYLILLVFLILGFVIWPILGSSMGAITVSAGTVDVGGTFTGFWDAFTSTWSRIIGRVDQITTLYTNPDYYTGRVDENKDKPLGITFTDVRPLDPEIANDSQIVLFGNVETKSFIGEEVQIIPGCLIDRTGAPAVTTIDPVPLEVVFGTTGSFECAFDAPPDGWRRGTYTVKATATFPCETWAYLPYTFVDEEKARAYARQGLEVRKELGIDQDPDAVYTSGPVVLGMGGSDQPILVRPDDAKNNYLAPGSRVGVTLTSGWQEGKLTHVRSIQLKVPQGFILTGCDRNITGEPIPDQNAPGYLTYLFENPDDLSIAVDYTTITCKIGLSDAQEAAALTGVGDKVERTFVAVATYEYTTEDRAPVKVR